MERNTPMRSDQVQPIDEAPDNKEIKYDKKKRQEAEKLIYEVLDAADKTHTNSDYYKQLFASMTDEQFYKFFQRRLPIRFHQSAFKVEPKMYEITEAFKKMKVPLFERVNLPYLHKDENGNPIQSKEALVMYLHIKRMKQMLSKKNNTAINIANRDMQTGLLTNHDKGGKTSDREFEAAAILNLDWTMDELARPRADGMVTKEKMYSAIADKGYVTAEEVGVEPNESSAQALLYTYLIGANIISNIQGEDGGYVNPLTLQNRKDRTIERS